jgi:hypothetical protein
MKTRLECLHILKDHGEFHLQTVEGKTKFGIQYHLFHSHFLRVSNFFASINGTGVNYQDNINPVLTYKIRPKLNADLHLNTNF